MRLHSQKAPVQMRRFMVYFAVVKRVTSKLKEVFSNGYDGKTGGYGSA